MRPGRLSLLCVALALAGCGSDVDETLTARAFQAFGQAAVGQVRAPVSKPLNLTRAALATLPPADLATVEARGAEAVIFEIARNGDTETWSSVDDKTLAIRQGQIVATRGLRGDLVAADVPPLSRIAGGSGSHDRVLVTIGPDEKTLRSRYACTLSAAGGQTVTLVQRSYPTRRVQETCSGGGRSFTNEYWFQGGTLRQSRQWMGQDLGHILLSRLRD
ncbi:MAG: YjbF family lipoprotein [Gemmobacter sp.]